MKPILLVLAAGMGSRYGGLKQIDPVGPFGETILDYSVYDAIKAGFGKIIFVIRQDIRKEFDLNVGQKFKSFIDIDYVFQELNKIPTPFTLPEERIKPWGTGHAILCASDKISEPFAVINADDFYGFNAFLKMAEFLIKVEEENCLNLAMIGYKLANTLSEFGTVARGVCKCSGNQKLVDILEITGIEKIKERIICKMGDIEHEFIGDEPVSMNFWGFTPGIFKRLNDKFSFFLKNNIKNSKSEFYIPFAIDELIKSKEAEVTVIKTDEKWFGVTYKEDKPVVIDSITKLIRDGKYPEKLF